MRTVAIIGLATLDELIRSDGPIVSGQTIAAQFLGHGAAHCGGAPYYTGRALAAGGHQVTPIFAVGHDPAGSDIVEACRKAGLAVTGIVRSAAQRTPRCLIIQQPIGVDICLVDTGNDVSDLVDAQIAAIERAELVIIAATPARSIAQALARVRTGQRVAWIFKDDPTCFPDLLCRHLMRRADFVFCNKTELLRLRRWEADVRRSSILFTTLGPDGVTISTEGRDVHLATPPLIVDNTIGAGDTFAGHVLAALIGGAAAAEAASNALDQTGKFLKARLTTDRSVFS